ncbi:hypothetical protein [Nakamurella deserti]|uniref:hypothetical protein n=1 Tax=Nakamurella deserti TaxID=2164074 RepID=UPI000DBE7B8D|nr:hypothetical protein [Nakamurella deserti]
MTSPNPRHQLLPATRPGLRLGVAGVALLVVALVHLTGVFTATTADDPVGSAVVHLAMAGVGVALVVAGLVRSARR